MNSPHSEPNQDFYEETKTGSPRNNLFDLERQGPFIRRSGSMHQQREADFFDLHQKASSSFIVPAKEKLNASMPLIENSGLRRTEQMENEINSDPDSKTIWWILARLEEMGFLDGLEGNPRVVKRMIRSYPAGTSKDFIAEAIIQNMLEGDQNEEDNRQGLELDRQSSGERVDEYEKFMQEISVILGKSTPNPLGRREVLCQFCSAPIEGNQNDFRVFNCAHVFCRRCLLVKFQERIKNGEDIEKFQCIEYECNNRIVVDKFVNLIPEADQRDLEDKENGTCAICFEDIKGNEELLKVFECQNHFFCYSCTVNFVKEAINNLKVLDIKCPDATCKSPVVDTKMKDLIPVYLFNKYSRFKRNALIERDPNIRWCTRPGCERVVKGSKTKPKAICECGQATCVSCGNPWHGKKTCEQALEEEYKMFAKQKDLQFCPECKSRVEKLAGCNHMTCPICTYEWCWLCGGEYSPGHFDTLNPLGCPGLMSGSNTRQDWSKCKIIAYRFAIMMLFVLLLALAPLWIVLGAILLPNLLYEARYYHSTAKTILIRAFLLILGGVLSPLTIVCGAVGAIVPGTCLLGNFLYKRYQEKAAARRRRQQLIKNRGQKAKQDEILRNELDVSYQPIQEEPLIRNNNSNNLTRPLLLGEEYLPMPRGDVSIDID